MKSALIITTEIGNQGGGLSKSCYAFACLLRSAGLDVTVVISSYVQVLKQYENEDFREFHVLKNSVEVVQGGYKPSLFNHLFFRGHVHNVIEQLKANKPDIIISFGGGYNGLFAAEINKVIKSKLVIILRGSELNLAITDRGLFHANLQSLKDAAAIIGVSSELLQRSKEIYYNPNAVYKVIPNVIHFNGPSNHLLRKTNIIFGVGARYLNEKKGIANLIHTLYYLNYESEPNFILKLAGEVDLELHAKYSQLAVSLGVDKSISFLGNLNKHEFYKELDTWDFVVQSSFCEGFSNTIGDAISVGKPFMTTNTGFIAEIIKDVAPELIFNDLSPKAIAERIQENYFNKDFLAWSNKAAEHIKGRVSKDAVSTLWVETFKRVCSHKPVLPITCTHILSLMLHDVSEECYSNIDIPKKAFEDLCRLVYSEGLQFCSAKVYFESTRRDNLVVLTFDDAYQGVYEFALPVLKKYSFSATVFVCTDYIGCTNSWNPKDRSTRQHMDLACLKELQENNWEIGSHGTNHMSFLRLGTDKIIEALENSKEALAGHFGEVVSFAYPYGDYNEHASRLAKSYYQNIFAVDKGGTHVVMDRHQIRRYTADELLKILSYESNRDF